MSNSNAICINKLQTANIAFPAIQLLVFSKTATVLPTLLTTNIPNLV